MPCFPDFKFFATVHGYNYHNCCTCDLRMAEEQSDFLYQSWNTFGFTSRTFFNCNRQVLGLAWPFDLLVHVRLPTFELCPLRLPEYYYWLLIASSTWDNFSINWSRTFSYKGAPKLQLQTCWRKRTRNLSFSRLKNEYPSFPITPHTHYPGQHSVVKGLENFRKYRTSILAKWNNRTFLPRRIRDSLAINVSPSIFFPCLERRPLPKTEHYS